MSSAALTTAQGKRSAHGSKELEGGDVSLDEDCSLDETGFAAALDLVVKWTGLPFADRSQVRPAIPQRTENSRP